MQHVYLQRLTLNDFRAFKNASIELPPNGVVMLAGANSAGKSCLLSALDVILGRDMPIAVEHRGVANPRIVARFALSEHDRLSAIGDDILSGEDTDGEIFQWLEWEYAVVPQNRLPIALRTSWFGGQELELARIQRTSNFGSPTWQLEAVRLPSIRTPAELIPLQNMSSGNGEPPGWIENFQSGQLFTVCTDMLNLWKGGVYHFPAMRQGTTRSWQIGSTPLLNPTGDNLPAVLLDLQTNRPKLWSQVQELMRSIVPDIGDLSIMTGGAQIEACFEDPYSGVRHNLKDVGTGVEQLLLTVVVGLTHPTAKTISIEEPETALHPAAQRAMLGLFHRWSTDKLFIVTTHSPVFLDTRTGDSMIYAVRREDGTSFVTRAEPSLTDVMRDLGVRLSDVLSADRILLVEGPSDRDVLGKWWPQLLIDPRVAVILGQGGRNARFAGMLHDWLSKADRVDSRTVLYLRDRDELDPVAVAKLTEQGTVHVLARREIENYLFDPSALVKYFALSKVSATVEDVTDVLRAAADETRPTVVLKTVLGRLPAVSVINDDLKRSLTKEHANCDAVVRAVAERLLTAETIESQIRSLWKAAEEDIDRRWADEWLALAPGEEVLGAVFEHFLKRGYGKTFDAGNLAAFVVPPADLASVVEEFLGISKSSPVSPLSPNRQ